MKIFLILTLVSCALADTDLCAVNDQLNNHLVKGRFNRKPGNIVFSSFSLLTPLAQLVLASGGSTQQEILNGLNIPAKDIHCTLKKALPSVSAKLKLIKEITYSEASKIYINEHLKLNRKFQIDTERLFGSTIEPVDFNTPTTPYKINAWVSQQTNKTIRHILNPRVPLFGTSMMLVNAVYYSAEWAMPFEHSQTWPNYFHISNSKSIKIPFMHQLGLKLYAESALLNAKLLLLPYEGGKANLLLVVPNTLDGIQTVLDNLHLLKEERKHLLLTQVFLSLPKFRVETETDLKRSFQSLGIHSIFTGRANLTNLLAYEQHIHVSSATQRSYIEINEEGTVAAASNIIEGVGSRHMDPVGHSIAVLANRPFYYELTVGSVKLFSGVKAN